MNAFIEFLKEYWFQLATGLFAIIEIILIVVKRKPKSIDQFKLLFQEVLARVPEYVSYVEEPGHGPEKLSKVVKLALGLLSNKLGRKLSDDEVALVIESVTNAVEAVLSAPTKKENKNV